MPITTKIHRQKGAALLVAMLTVALVTSLSAAAFWSQWQSWYIEKAEQQQTRYTWLLFGALDWARLILREDARSGNIDHLSEPWSIPLQEARISSFLAASHQNSDEILTTAFLSGSIHDEQSKFNIRNLLGNDLSDPALSRFDANILFRLFAVLGLPASEATTLTELLIDSYKAGSSTSSAVMLPPQRLSDVTRLGLTANTLAKLEPYVSWLPERTPVNINTASPEVIHAVTGLSMPDVRRVIQARAQGPFSSTADLADRTQTGQEQWPADRVSLNSRFFIVTGQLRLDESEQREQSLLLRQGSQVLTVWRDRLPAAPKAILAFR